MRVVFLLLLLAGCATAPACAPGQQAGVLAEAFFGRNIGPALGVGSVDWAEFVDAELTPRFPDGLSVTDMAGQFRGADGLIVREPAKRVSLVLTEPDRQRPLLAEAVAAYKARFRQEAVLVVETPACVAF